MNCVVEIDASQDREHVGLQERDQQFERGQRQWHNAADPTYCAEQGDEPRKYLERVACCT